MAEGVASTRAKSWTKKRPRRWFCRRKTDLKDPTDAMDVRVDDPWECGDRTWMGRGMET